MAKTRAVGYEHLLFLISCIWFGIVLFTVLRVISGRHGRRRTRSAVLFL